MAVNERRSELIQVFQSCDPETLKVIDRLIDEVVFLEDRMSDLRRLPFLNVHPMRPELQKSTPAARQYKECMQSYMNAIRILCGILAKTEPSAQDELLKRLEEFSL